MWLLLAGLSAAQTTIDFDNLTPGCNFIGENALSTEYLAQGVEFQGPGGLDGGAVLDECGNFGVSGHSSPNFLAFNTGSGLASGGTPAGPETLLFTPAATYVSFLGGSASAGTVTATAYDASGIQVDQDVIATGSTLSLFELNGAIAEVVISFSGSVLVVDDLYFEANANPNDMDGDGVDVGLDCDDNNAQVYPGAPELCDGLDNDCDGIVPADEFDGDFDGFRGCDGDCDDADSSSYPGAAEICDGLDNDCDGTIADAELDLDSDGQAQCDGDCDDAEPTVYPGAPELCDGLDNDCSGQPEPDEVDLDSDGYPECDDCDDNDPNTFPGAPEVDGDGIDNDCDGYDGQAPTGTATGGGPGTGTGAGTGTGGATGTGTGADADIFDPKLGGCGCSTSPVQVGPWLLLPLLLTRRRTR